jgi:hypothetical protein
MVDIERGWGATASMVVNVVFGCGVKENVVIRWEGNVVTRWGAAVVIRVVRRWEVLGAEMPSLFTCGVIAVNR